MKRFFLPALLSVCLSGCLGYRIGPIQPHYLKDIHTIAVPTFRNATLHPRIEVLVTSTVIKQFQQDGTYRITSDEKADAVLKGEILSITRVPTRYLTGNTLATVEFGLTMRVRYSLVDRAGRDLCPNTIASGSTTFFVSSDVASDERQALPLAAERVATHLVSQLSEGW